MRFQAGYQAEKGVFIEGFQFSISHLPHGIFYTYVFAWLVAYVLHDCYESVLCLVCTWMKKSVFGKQS